LKDHPHEETSLPSFYPVEVTIYKKERSLEAELKLGFQRGITLEIENTGEAEVNNINWSITILRRGIIKRELMHEHNTISSLDQGKETIIKELPKFGFWPVIVYVTVNSDDIEEPIHITAKGFIMFRFIRLRRFFQ
jgi:hypothetical protein